MPQPPAPPLVGSIFERSSGSSSSFKSASSSSPSPSGFPTVQHRSKSAFARSREAKRSNGAQDSETRRSQEVPTVKRSGDLLLNDRGREEQRPSLTGALFGSPYDSSSDISVEEPWKVQMRRDNDRVVEAMSVEERERHAAEVLEQLGPNVTELLQKAREARVGVEPGPDSQERVIDNSQTDDKHDDAGMHGNSKHSISNVEGMQQVPSVPPVQNKLASPRRGILVSNTPPSSRSSSPGRTARKLRFADVTPKDVHVFQSEPSSPRKPLCLLPPPPEHGSKSDVVKISLGPKLEKGTPEDIRRRFFPDQPADNRALEWINPTGPAPDTEPRYDLSASLIPPAERETLPTHLGLHHHGGSTSAGYTLADLFLLARSSVPAQRATILGVLSKLVRRLARQEKEASELKDRDTVRSQALAVGLVALAEKGMVGVQAIGLVWTCVVYWDENEVEDLEGVELRPLGVKTSQADDEKRPENSLSSVDTISSIPFSVLFPQIAVLFGAHSLPTESASQLLSILLRFARHSIEIANAITETPRLIGIVVDTFLLTPISPSADGSDPNPLALDLLRALALASRANARALEGPADAVLRFVTTAASSSVPPAPRILSDNLLCSTLKLYAALGMYGIYSGIATTAAEHFNRLSSYIVSNSDDVSIELKTSWLRLLSVWVVCARDPHRTTPTHDLLWSQVVGWAWGDDLLGFRNNLLSGRAEPDSRVWGAACGALASWLEGCSINIPKKGQDEREVVSVATEKAWSAGVEKKYISNMGDQLMRELHIAFSGDTSAARRKAHVVRVAELSQVLTEFVRLCLACLQKRTSDSGELGGGRADAPSWIVDAFSLLSPVAYAILSCDVWRAIKASDSSQELSFRIQLSHLRSVSDFLASFVRLSRTMSNSDMWLPIAFATLEALLQGDEENARWIVGEFVDNECRSIECAEKLQFLMPFFENAIRQDDDSYLSPLIPTPESIQRSTTQCLLANCISSTSSKQAVSGLPLSPDWPCIALDHLLRSGSSPILTNPDSVPDSWNASETDLAQASLSLLLYVERTLSGSDLQAFAPSFEHVVFNCMKIFMLEHNQQQNDSNEEVFRDTTVGRLMDNTLEPFTLRGSHSAARTGSINLETVAKGFLGAGTPFFQFYTDFVGLYDAISFSHGTFARLLLPPISMAYAHDYRKLLWGDFGHNLRTVRTPIDDVPTLDLKQFFWPVETDADMLGWYLRALVKWPLFGFVRFLAVHHVACNIWSDLCEVGEASRIRENRARTLLATIFNQAKSDVMKDVANYVQNRTADLRLPPECHQLDDDLKSARLSMVRGMGGTAIVESMEKIYNEQN